MTDITHNRIAGYCDAFLHINLQKHTFKKALNFEIRLIRFNLEQDIPLCNRVSHLLQPLDNGTLFHGLTQLRENNGLRHKLSLYTC